MTDRSDIERLLNQTGRTLEGLMTEAEYCDSKDYGDRCEELDRALSECGFESSYPCMFHQSDVIELLVGALRDALTERDAALAKQPKWISVKERLPEDGELVLVTMNGEIHGAKLFNHAYELACYYRDGEDEEGEYHIDGWELWDYRDGEVSALEVFYWMPLPEPPEEEAHETTD